MMKKRNSVPLLVAGLICASICSLRAQSTAPGTLDAFITTDSVTRGEYTLLFINKREGFDEQLKKTLIEVYFKVYPVMAKDFDNTRYKKVTFIIDPAYTGVAATSNNIVRFNPEWFEKYPKDIDVVTHEVMHIVQSYRRRPGPGWITEGIADYVRYKYGVDNEGGGWSLTPFSPTHHYTNSYRITARFFAWIEKKVPGFVKKINEQMRNGTYSDDTFKKITGKTIDDWWREYAEDPSL